MVKMIFSVISPNWPSDRRSSCKSASEDFVLTQPLASPSIWKPELSISQSQTSLSKPVAFEIKFLVDHSLVEKLIPAVTARMPLRPTLCIAYDGVAFLQMENLGPIHLTIDCGMGCCADN